MAYNCWLSILLLVSGLICVTTSDETKDLIFNVLNSSFLEVEWPHLLELKLEDIQEVILYQVSPKGYNNIGFAKYPKTKVLVKHDICLPLKRIFMRIRSKDLSKLDPTLIFGSPESSYYPNNFTNVSTEESLIENKNMIESFYLRI